MAFAYGSLVGEIRLIVDVTKLCRCLWTETSHREDSQCTHHGCDESTTQTESRLA